MLCINVYQFSICIHVYMYVHNIYIYNSTVYNPGNPGKNENPCQPPPPPRRTWYQRLAFTLHGIPKYVKIVLWADWTVINRTLSLKNEIVGYFYLLQSKMMKYSGWYTIFKWKNFHDIPAQFMSICSRRTPPKVPFSQPLPSPSHHSAPGSTHIGAGGGVPIPPVWVTWANGCKLGRMSPNMWQNDHQIETFKKLKRRSSFWIGWTYRYFLWVNLGYISLKYLHVKDKVSERIVVSHEEA